MKIIVAGSRSIFEKEVVRAVMNAAIREGFRVGRSQIEEIVTGGAIGVDQIAHDIAIEQGYETRVFLPDYTAGFGRQAPLIRNRMMAEYVGKEGGCIVIWDGESTGSINMFTEAHRVGMPVYVHRYDPPKKTGPARRGM